MPDQKPDLELGVEIERADGVIYRWHANARAGDVPQGITFRTKRGDGFADGPSIVLQRPADIDVRDVGLYDTIRLTGAGGETAYEGRVTGLQRGTEGSHTLTVTVGGWMTHAQDRDFSAIYVDRDMGGWGETPLDRRAQLAAAGRVQSLISGQVESSGLSWDVPVGTTSPALTAELEYLPPYGETVRRLAYQGQRTGTWTNFEGAALFAAADYTYLGSAEGYALTLDNTVRFQTLTTSRARVLLRAYATGAVSPTAGTLQTYKRLAVYGSSPIPTYPVANEPDGVVVSDVIRDICSRFCPKLNPAGVLSTTYVLSHVAFKDRTRPYDAFQELNRTHNWSLSVWENRTLYYHPTDLTDWDWEVRLHGPEAASIQFSGDTIEDFSNGVVVNYPDAITGEQTSITPEIEPSLADPDPRNPATTHGVSAWHTLNLPFPAVRDDATQFGRIALADRNTPRQPATISVVGHVRDRAGRWQPGWKVRADDRIIIVDHPNSDPRLIVETQWDHDSHQLTIGVDQTIGRADALLDRIQTQLRARNLT